MKKRDVKEVRCTKVERDTVHIVLNEAHYRIGIKVAKKKLRDALIKSIVWDIVSKFSEPLRL